jgi:hypothetical protein
MMAQVLGKFARATTYFAEESCVPRRPRLKKNVQILAPTGHSLRYSRDELRGHYTM